MVRFSTEIAALAGHMIKAVAGLFAILGGIFALVGLFFLIAAAVVAFGSKPDPGGRDLGMTPDIAMMGLWAGVAGVVGGGLLFIPWLQLRRQKNPKDPSDSR